MNSIILICMHVIQPLTDMYMLLLYMLTYHLIYVELTETYLGYITFY
jgi:hypothetical protein